MLSFRSNSQPAISGGSLLRRPRTALHNELVIWDSLQIKLQAILHYQQYIFSHKSKGSSLRDICEN